MASDFCNEDGARRLKSKIEEYWKNRGFDVNIDLVDAGFIPAMRSARTDVRSNMVNGMPQSNNGGGLSESGTRQAQYH
jgi:hypothetical protein